MDQLLDERSQFLSFLKSCRDTLMQH
jgi:hypothetical protein